MQLWSSLDGSSELVSGLTIDGTDQGGFVLGPEPAQPESSVLPVIREQTREASTTIPLQTGNFASGGGRPDSHRLGATAVLQKAKKVAAN